MIVIRLIIFNNFLTPIPIEVKKYFRKKQILDWGKEIIKN